MKEERKKERVKKLKKEGGKKEKNMRNYQKA